MAFAGDIAALPPLFPVEECSIVITRIPYGMGLVSLLSDLVGPAGGTVEFFQLSWTGTSCKVTYRWPHQARQAVESIRNLIQENVMMRPMFVCIMLNCETAIDRFNYRDFIQHTLDSPRTLHVTNLSALTTRQSMEVYFAGFSILMRPPDIYRSRLSGQIYGYVTYLTVQDRNTALMNANGQFLDLSRIDVGPYRIRRPYQLGQVRGG